MDIQRIILIAGITIISYLLVLQWQQDYSSTAPVSKPNRSISAYENEPNQTNSISEFVSVVPDNPIDSAPVEHTTTGDLIEVITDTLKVVIDPRGGDIIHVDLPKYLANIDNPNIPFTLLEQNSERTYVAQSGLTGKNGTDVKVRPMYQATQSKFELADDQDQLQVVMSLSDMTGSKIRKVYTFNRNSYLINLTYVVDNQGDSLWSANLFGQIKRDRSDDPNKTTDMGMSAYLGPAFSLAEDKYLRYDFGDMESTNFKRQASAGWVAMLQHYFVSAWIPNPNDTHTYSTRISQGNYIAGFVSPSLDLAPGENGSVSANFYAGPKIQNTLKAIAPNLNLVVDYGWLWWIAQPLFVLMKAMHDLVNNWGVAILLVTLCVKAIFFYPSAISYRSMAKMRALAPEITKLKERFGDDRQKMSQAVMELYKREKANPISGCFPILIQMPVFLGLYWMLMESVELRHAPFFLWIRDLSVMDPYFVLPLIMGGSMFVQQLLNPTPPDPMQAKIMKMLPIVFTIFFLWFPAGLVLYWVCNNVLSIAQQYVITRKIEAAMNKPKH
jgi:YidC/Oxa1 family membrane protein insertase